MANRFTFPVSRALDSNADSGNGFKLDFFQTGTSTRQDTFSDNALTSANANPVIADSAGRFGDIFLQALDYKVILKDAADATIWTADPVSGSFVVLGDEFVPGPSSPEAMTIDLGAGTLFTIVAKTLVVVAVQTSPLMVAPSVNPRNDMVHIDRLTGVVAITTGTEAASPVDPTIPDGKLLVARVRLAITTTQVGSSLIDDIRELNQLGDFGPQDIQGQTLTAFNDTGAVNAYVITPVPAITAYAKYQTWVVDIGTENTGASTMNISALGVRNIFNYRTGAALTGGELVAGLNRFVDDGTQLILMTPRTGVLQVVEIQDGAVATGTTTIPNDDTIPQNTEGDEYMTLAITPKSASSRLRIDVVAALANSSTSLSTMAGALFRDSIADALAAFETTKPSTAGVRGPISFSHDMASPGASATTFKMRAGLAVAGTTTFNGTAGGRIFGGVMASSIIITEYLP